MSSMGKDRGEILTYITGGALVASIVYQYRKNEAYDTKLKDLTEIVAKNTRMIQQLVVDNKIKDESLERVKDDLDEIQTSLLRVTSVEPVKDKMMEDDITTLYRALAEQGLMVPRPSVTPVQESPPKKFFQKQEEKLTERALTERKKYITSFNRPYDPNELLTPVEHVSLPSMTAVQERFIPSTNNNDKDTDILSLLDD